MPSLQQPERRLERAALLLTILSVAGLLALAQLRGSWRAVAGDESTFLAMAESLAYDLDLEFTNRDRARLEVAGGRELKTVILQRSADRISYSKPVIYPLVAAPAYRLFGRAGMYLVNALAIAAALVIFWRSALRRSQRGAWALTIATFAATGAVLPQVAWAMGDALQLALALAAGTLAFEPEGDRTGGPGGAVAAGLLLGLLISMRLPNAILVAALIAAVAVDGRRRRSGMITGATLGGFALATLLNLAFVGSANPYRAERATFDETIGYPAGAGSERAFDQFVEGRATQRLGARPDLRPRVTAYSSLYFLIGRHTGMLFYLPAAILLGAAALRSGGRARRLLLFGIAGLAVFYLVWMPENYFGGASFVGNRYFLPAYALLLPALRRPPRATLLLGVWVLSAVLFASALGSILAERPRPFTSQSHAYGGLWRWLPYESTALSIEYGEDRYLSDEFLRFVDRNSRPRDHGFHVEAGSPPAEVLVATPRPSGILRFLVRVDRPEADLIYRDWRGSRRLELEAHPEGARGLVEIVAAPAWRRHPFWWTGDPWHAHSIRLSLETPDGGPAAADLRYLGPYRLAEKFFAYRLARLRLPERGVAGTTASVPVRLVNRGLRPWLSDADVPIHLAHSIRREPVPSVIGGSGARLEFTEIPLAVEPGESVELAVELRWPRKPGRYRLELDLAVAGVELFQKWLGAPIASTLIEVVAPREDTAAVVSSN